MMDNATLDAFARFIVEASESSYEIISQLTVEEGRAYQRVKTGNLLLEQEKIITAFPCCVTFGRTVKILIKNFTPFLQGAAAWRGCSARR